MYPITFQLFDKSHGSWFFRNEKFADSRVSGMMHVKEVDSLVICIVRPGTNVELHSANECEQ